MKRTNSAAVAAAGLLIAAGVIFASSGSAAVTARPGTTIQLAALGQTSNGAAAVPGPLEQAAAALRSAIRYEENARSAGSSDQWKPAVEDIDLSHSNLARAAAAVTSAGSDGAIDKSTERQIVTDIADAEALDAKADKAAARADANSLKHRLTKALAEKETALRVLATVKPKTTPSPRTNTITSPVGSGTLVVTKVLCYANGTGGNPERDADLSLNGVAGWHAQEVYPASYIKGGSPSAPMVFIENGPAPYNAPTTTIYAALGTTVSGDISVVGSGQLVMVRGTLVDPKTGLPVTGGSINLNFACNK